MVRGVGLDAGAFEIKVVELDGSYRKARLAKLSIERVRVDGAVADVGGSGWLDPLKDVAIHKENVTLGVSGRDVVLRTLTVPFSGVDAIRKVIKFETEGQIHSHSVDDMVVDFQVLDQVSPSETRVLVAAVPKARLKTTLTSLESLGLEPEVVDLDAMALLRVADWCGVLGPAVPARRETKKDPDAPPAPQAVSRVILDVGARATRILVVVGGRLRDLRTLRVGADGVADEIALKYGLSTEEARQAVHQTLATGVDHLAIAAMTEEVPQIEPPEGGQESGAEEGAALVPAGVTVSAEVVRATIERFLERFRRELMRSFAGIRDLDQVETAFVTGGGSLLPGVHAVLEESLGLQLQPLDVLGQLSHDLSEEEVQQINPRIAVAVGLALRAFGGTAGFNFRQEDLVFTKQFDRIKFPLAITAMLALFLAVVYALRAKKELDNLEWEVGATLSIGEDQVRPGGRGGARPIPQYYGNLGFLLARGRWFGQETFYDRKSYEDLTTKLLDVPVFNRVAFVRQELANYLRKLQNESGVYEGLRVGSGYAVLNAAAKVIEQAAPALGRFLVTELHLVMRPEPQARYLTLTLALRGDDHTRKYRAIEERFEQAALDPKSPFSGVASGTRSGVRSAERPFRDGESGAYYDIRIDLKPEATFPTFPSYP